MQTQSYHFAGDNLMHVDPGTTIDEQHHNEVSADSSISGFQEESKSNSAIGSSIREDDLTKALDASFDAGDSSTSSESSSESRDDSFQLDFEQNFDEQDNESPDDSSEESEVEANDNPSSDASETESEDVEAESEDVEAETEEPASNQLTLDPATLVDSQELDPNQVQEETNLSERLGENGDVLDGGGGNNVVVGAGESDIILGNAQGAFNTITTGTGEDLIVLGQDSTNRVFDFDPAADQFGLDGFGVEDIVFGQGSNPDNGGLDQPLDSTRNTVVVDRATSNILASLTFTNAGELSEDNFVTVSDEELAALTA